MLLIEHLSPSLLKPNLRNPRVNDVAVDAVARSIQEFGFNQPIVTDGDLNIAAGHTRLKAALKLGMETVPVIRVPGLVGSRYTGYLIADNATHDWSSWDEELLAQIVSELNLESDFDLGSLGFDDSELTKLLDTSVDDEDDKEDDAPPLPEVPFSKPGDLFILGDHRLLCGDATDPNSYKALLAGEKIDCLITDPPYGVSYMSRGKKREEWGGILNDDLSPDALETFLRKVLTNVAGVARPGMTAYVCHALGLAGVRIAFERAFLSAGFQLSATVIWVKQCATIGWGDYRHQAEPILYGWIGEGHRKIKDRTQSTVWQIDREVSLKHPTQKPCSLYGRALRNSTIRGEKCLDVFVGSGTAIIASEQLGRRCFAMELEPKYVDVSVQRWEQYTGRKAELIRPAAPAVEEVTQVDV